MQCDYFDAGACRSCGHMGQAYAAQVQAKQAHVAAMLDAWPEIAWSPPAVSAESGFRNKAKMVAGGTVEAPTLGILDESGRGVDLRDCGIHEPVLTAALPVLAEFVTRAALTPYDVPRRRGELKHVLVTASPDGALMVRWVLRSSEPVLRIRKHLPWLRERLPHLAVASVNLQPAHAAVLEGEHEEILTEQTALTMRVAGMSLRLRPGGFFQTNSAMAEVLYEQARSWAGDLSPRSVWDLYAGVGGFALALASPGRRVIGVEMSQEAVAGARESAAGLDDVAFLAGDAAAYARGEGVVPDLVVVNPPRRGIGPDLAAWLEGSGVPSVLYSSCHPVSLARDLRAMGSLLPVRARLIDMFPQTDHAETLVLLRRAPTAPTGQ